MSKPILYKEPVQDSIKRICKVCEKEKQLNLEFRFHKTYECYSHICKGCAHTKRKLIKAGEPIPIEFEKANKRRREKRVSENKPYRKTTYINRRRLTYRSFDKKRGLENDLTVEYIEDAFKQPCSYCGAPATGLDRLDNTVGHTMSNCVPSCYDCNIIKSDIFSYDEMKVLGLYIKMIKKSRII